MHVTLLGGTGFVGRALAARLVKDGASVRVAARHAADAEGLPEGVERRTADVRDPRAGPEAVADTDAVVYLPGCVTGRTAEPFRELHVNAPRACAQAAARAGARRFVFLSALGVRWDAPALADRTKAEGERAVANVFADATSVRAGLTLGPGDHVTAPLASAMRRFPVLPVLGARTRLTPLHIDDLVAAVAAVLDGHHTAGRTYELGGPVETDMLGLCRAVRRAAGARCWLPPLPEPLAMLAGAAAELAAGPPFCRDQVRLMRTPKVPTGELPQADALGLTPRDPLPELAGLLGRA